MTVSPLIRPQVLAIWATALMVADLGSGQTNSRPLTVCEVLSNPARYDGQVIRVRGILSGSSEGTWLLAASCPKPIIFDGHEWPLAISLAYGSSLSHKEDLPVRVGPDKDRIRQFDDKIARMARPKGDYEIWVTYVGQFQSRRARVYKLGSRVIPVGYGHVSGCRAQLGYQYPEDPEFVPIEAK